MAVLRSFLFNVCLYLNTLVMGLLWVPSLVMPRRFALAGTKIWARNNSFFLRHLCGIDVEIIGRERLPKGPLLVAAKHQSAWETYMLLKLVDDPAFILKRELAWIPVFGWYLLKTRMIPIDRSAGTKALKGMTQHARVAAAEGRQIIIFPEGTRKAPGEPPGYKYGVVHLYDALKVPCVPIALNSGLYWPRRSMTRTPGTIRLEFLDPIPPGLDKRSFLTRLEAELETASNRLLAQGRAEIAAARGEATASAPDADRVT